MIYQKIRPVDRSELQKGNGDLAEAMGRGITTKIKSKLPRAALSAYQLAGLAGGVVGGPIPFIAEHIYNTLKREPQFNPPGRGEMTETDRSVLPKSTEDLEQIRNVSLMGAGVRALPGVRIPNIFTKNTQIFPARPQPWKQPAGIRYIRGKGGEMTEYAGQTRSGNPAFQKVRTSGSQDYSINNPTKEVFPGGPPDTTPQVAPLPRTLDSMRHMEGVMGRRGIPVKFEHTSSSPPQAAKPPIRDMSKLIEQLKQEMSSQLKLKQDMSSQLSSTKKPGEGTNPGKH